MFSSIGFCLTCRRTSVYEFDKGGPERVLQRMIISLGQTPSKCQIRELGTRTISLIALFISDENRRKMARFARFSSKFVQRYPQFS